MTRPVLGRSCQEVKSHSLKSQFVSGRDEFSAEPVRHHMHLSQLRQRTGSAPSEMGVRTSDGIASECGQKDLHQQSGQGNITSFEPRVHLWKSHSRATQMRRQSQTSGPTSHINWHLHFYVMPPLFLLLLRPRLLVITIERPFAPFSSSDLFLFKPQVSPFSFSISCFSTPGHFSFF